MCSSAENKLRPEATGWLNVQPRPPAPSLDPSALGQSEITTEDTENEEPGLLVNSTAGALENR